MRSAAETIKDARARARLSQAELAARAGIAQAAVSAYENGKRQPSVEALQRLMLAAGFELKFVLAPLGDRSPLQLLLAQHGRALKKRLKALGATDVRVFGSVARGEDADDSDIDLLVDVDASIGLFALGEMRSAAEQILGRTVDIVPSHTLKPDLEDRVLREAVRL